MKLDRAAERGQRMRARLDGEGSFDKFQASTTTSCASLSSSRLPRQSSPRMGPLRSMDTVGDSPTDHDRRPRPTPDTHMLPPMEHTARSADSSPTMMSNITDRFASLGTMLNPFADDESD